MTSPICSTFGIDFDQYHTSKKKTLIHFKWWMRFNHKINTSHIPSHIDNDSGAWLPSPLSIALSHTIQHVTGELHRRMSTIKTCNFSPKKFRELKLFGCMKDDDGKRRDERLRRTAWMCSKQSKNFVPATCQHFSYADVARDIRAKMCTNYTESRSERCKQTNQWQFSCARITHIMPRNNVFFIMHATHTRHIYLKRTVVRV